MKIKYNFIAKLKPANKSAKATNIRRLIQSGVEVRRRLGDLRIGAQRRFAGVWWEVVAVGREGFMPTVDWKMISRKAA
jgi:hypothetical protein